MPMTVKIAQGGIHLIFGKHINKYYLKYGYMMLLGLENGYMQEHESADSSFVPDWNMI